MEPRDRIGPNVWAFLGIAFGLIGAGFALVGGILLQGPIGTPYERVMNVRNGGLLGLLGCIVGALFSLAGAAEPEASKEVAIAALLLDVVIGALIVWKITVVV